MKNRKCKCATCAAFILGCILPIASKAQDNHGHHQSGIIGQVEQVAGPWDIWIVTSEGKFVADIQADDTGVFQVDLKPGSYVLTPFVLSLDGTSALVGVSTTIIVEKRTYTNAELTVVNGPI